MSRASRVQSGITLATGAIGLVRQLVLGPQWGIFSESGKPLLVGDSVKGFDYKNDSRLADFPVEKGGFGNFNKVQTPWDARFSFTIGGGGPIAAFGGASAARAGFLDMCEKLLQELTIVVGVTPDKTYPSANVTHYDYRRTSQNGVTLLTVDVWLQEIRQTATKAFTNSGDAATTGTDAPSGTAEPSGADPQNTGTVQPTEATPAQTATTERPFSTAPDAVPNQGPTPTADWNSPTGWRNAAGQPVERNGSLPTP